MSNPSISLTQTLESQYLLRLGGELTQSYDFFQRKLIAYIESLKKGKLIIEMSDVTELDSTGVAVLVDAVGRAKKIGIKCEIRNPNSQVCEIFNQAKVERLLKIK